MRHTFSIHQQIIGASHEAQRRTGHWRVGFDLADFACRFYTGRNGLGERRFVTKATRHIDGAENDLQKVNGAAGLEAIGMGGNPTHRVHGYGTANHFFMAATGVIRPRNIEFNLLLEGDFCDFGSYTFNRSGWNTAFSRHGIG